MKLPKPDLVVLPFKATLAGFGTPVTLERAVSLLRGRHRRLVHIERSTPGAPDAIGWTIFRRTPKTYLHENEPFFRHEHAARRHIREAYAIHHSLNGEDGLTHSHLHL